jgi:hypothetical protein
MVMDGNFWMVIDSMRTYPVITFKVTRGMPEL